MIKSVSLFIVITFFTMGMSTTYADGPDYNDKASPLAPFLELINEEQYEQAIVELDKALRDDPENADMLNLMAYSHRKLGHFEIALKYYQQALGIEPEHRGANEYLGELYLQMGQLEKAEERLQVLDDECFFGCDEYDELEEAIADYRKQNPS